MCTNCSFNSFSVYYTSIILQCAAHGNSKCEKHQLKLAYFQIYYKCHCIDYWEHFAAKQYMYVEIWDENMQQSINTDILGEEE